MALVKEGRWEYVDRLGATGAAIVVAITNERKLLLVEQYRIPVHARTIELPADIIGDDPGGSDECHTGYAYHSVPVALYAWLRHRGDFRAAMAFFLLWGI